MGKGMVMAGKATTEKASGGHRPGKENAAKPKTEHVNMEKAKMGKEMMAKAKATATPKETESRDRRQVASRAEAIIRHEIVPATTAGGGSMQVIDETTQASGSCAL